MNKTELTILKSLLEDAHGEFCNHGCNDYTLPVTNDNLKFMRDVIAASDDPEDDIRIHGNEILTRNTFLMWYFIEKLEKELNGQS